MKFVIISKNCYPILGPRAHRTTELAKELSKRGHTVILYTLTGSIDYTNLSNETGIVFKNLGKSKFGIEDNNGYRNKSFVIKVLKKLFSKMLEFPNIELMKLTENVLKQEQDIDYLITIAYPHPIHWGAANFVEKNPNKIKFWVADCGDPYMKSIYKSHPWYFKYYEKKWCKLCDYITIPLENGKDGYYTEFQDKIKVIPQGFNFDEIKLANYQKNAIPTFAYSGHVYKGLRDPSEFLKFLTTLNFNFKFIVYSKSGEIFKEFKDELGEKLEIRGYIPREELLLELSQMDFLINIKNQSEVQAPSKLIDYALTKRPILEITSEFNEKLIFNEFISLNYINQLNINNVQEYNIINVVNKFLKLK